MQFGTLVNFHILNNRTGIYLGDDNLIRFVWAFEHNLVKLIKKVNFEF